MTTITDGFTRSGSNTLGTSSEGWSWAEVVGDIDVAASGVEAEVNNYSAHNYARANSDLASANHYAQVKVTQWSSATNSSVYVHARFASASDSSVVFYIQNWTGGNTYRLFKQTGTSFTQIGSTVSTTAPSVPFTARIEVDSSNVIKGLIDGVQKISGTDAFNSSAVRTGIGAVPISATVTLLDDFEAGDLSAPTSFPPTPMLLMPHLAM